MIHIANLRVKFRNELVFDNFSLDLNPGEHMAIWGKSGVGKTTLLNLLVGFIPDFQGEISVDGIALHPQTIQQIRQVTAWLPQEIVFDFNTVEELFYAAFNLESNREHMPTQDKIQAVFEAFELDFSILQKRVQEISGGQKQRVLLASCLLMNEPLLLLDEPTSALDEKLKKKITDYILGLQHTTILAVTHDSYWIEKSTKKMQLTDKIRT